MKESGDMAIDPIVFNDSVTPAYEWVLGRAIQKVSPKRRHARLQGGFIVALDPWSTGRGEVAPEWRFRITPPDGETRVLVPDVAFVRAARLARLDAEQREEPPIAPDVAVEILSPTDRRRVVVEKTRVYLAGGTALVLVVDPATRTMLAYDADGMREWKDGETFEHPAVPGLRIDLRALFARIE